MRTRLQHAVRAARSRESGQIMIMFAVFLVVLLVLAGSAYDYASIVVDDAQLQNAVDASLLAGSDALSRNISKGPSAAQTAAVVAATDYLRDNGVEHAPPKTTVNITFPTPTPVNGVTIPNPPLENVRVDVKRQHQTAFWPLVGINQVGMSGGGTARAARGLIDVVVAVDTTRSEVISGSIPTIQDAIVAFIDAMGPDENDRRSPRIALVRFQGLDCDKDHDGDIILSTCNDDVTVLTDTGITGDDVLSGDADALRWTAKNTSNLSPCLNTTYGCPVDYVSTSTDSTKLSNAINVVLRGNYANTGTPVRTGMTGTSSFGSKYIFEASGNRSDNTVGGNGYAKKVLIMMTDGDNLVPNGYTTSVNGYAATTTGWNTAVKDSARTLRAGHDGTVGTQDDVEIYTVNFQCAYTGDTSSSCTSDLAARGPNNHLCGAGSTSVPNTTDTSTGDEVLMDVSSSKRDGSGNLLNCDHYFPLLKNEGLPDLFRQLAGTISRGALTE